MAELIAERNKTAPGERHFFCEMNAAGTHIESVKLRRWNTYGEMLGLRGYLKRQMQRSVMIVSTNIHLRRWRWCSSGYSGIGLPRRGAVGFRHA
jgi:hypothetical protein